MERPRFRKSGEKNKRQRPAQGITHDRDNIDKNRRRVHKVRIDMHRPCIEINLFHHAVTTAERDEAHHQAYKMTMRTSTSVVRLETIAINRRNLRCDIVIDGQIADDSFAMRPL